MEKAASPQYVQAWVRSEDGRYTTSRVEEEHPKYAVDIEHNESDGVQGRNPENDYSYEPLSLLPEDAILANVLEEAAKECCIPVSEIEDVYPCAPLQEDYVLSLGEDGPWTNDPASEFFFALPGTTDLIRLSKALDILISQNPIFRTRLAHLSQGTMHVVCKHSHRRSSHFPQEVKESWGQSPDRDVSNFEPFCISENLNTYNDIQNKAQSSTDVGCCTCQREPDFAQGIPLFNYEITRGDLTLLPRLKLTFHHLLYDGPTVDKLLDDLSYNYSHPGQEREGRKPHVHFIRNLQSCNWDDSATYWKAQLKGTPIPNFPSIPDFVQHLQAKDSITLCFGFNMAKLKADTILIDSVVCAAWGLLLSSYSNDSVCYGIVMSGREDVGIENVAGPTISKVPMTFKASRSQKITDLLLATQKSFLTMRPHQNFGLQNIARLGPGPKNACNFRSLLVIERERTESIVEADVRFVREGSIIDMNYPIVVSSTPNQSTGELQLVIHYDANCFKLVQAQRMIRQLRHIIIQLANFDGFIDKIELVTEEDRKEIFDWNPLPPPCSQLCLHQVFERIVCQQSEAIAIETTSEIAGAFDQLPYRQLDGYANMLTRHILQRNSSNPLVGICLRKSPIAVISMLAILKAGWAFIPIDPSAPPERIEYVLRDLGPDVLVIIEQASIISFPNTNLVILDRDCPNLFHENNRKDATQGNISGSIDNRVTLSAEVSPKSTAYVLYTSGSSGTPKAVVISHHAITTALSGLAAATELTGDSRVLQCAAFTFDVSIMEIFGTLTSGGCVCMLSESETMSGQLGKASQELRASLMILTPTVFQLLDPEDLPSIKTVGLGGESSTKDLLREWTRTGVRILPGYGVTEASITSAVNHSLRPEEPNNIGRPVACRLFIADLMNGDRLAGIGAVGELVIVGRTVADGYLHNPESTSKSFGVKPAWLSNSNEDTRYYKTGDLAKYAWDGSLIFVGRKDLQIKIHGQRVELNEIEVLIMRSGKFRGCVVEFISPDTLIAFVVTEFRDEQVGVVLLPPESLPRSVLVKLKTCLQSKLPPLLIPSIYIPVGGFPTSASGKIDRRRLRASIDSVESYRLQSTGTKRQPETAAEEAMRQLWADAIPMAPEKIGIDDSFLSAGGDSVGVIRLLAAARKLGMIIDFKAVYQNTTLADMATALDAPKQVISNEVPEPFSLVTDRDSDQCISLVSSKCCVPGLSVTDVYPGTDFQETLMAASKKSPGSFFNQSVFYIHGRVDTMKLFECLEIIWNNYDILRTRIFLDKNSRNFQAVICERPEIVIFNGELDGYLTKEAACPPGYGQRLSRAAVIMSSSEKYLVISQHHAVYDGWSEEILLEIIKREYSKTHDGEFWQSCFSPFVKHVAQIQNCSEAGSYWKILLADLKVVPLPHLRSDSFNANQTYRTTLEIPSDSSYSLAIIVEAAWGLILSRYTGTEDVCFGVVRSGRTAPVAKVERLMAPTMVVIPRRLHPFAKSTVREYLAESEHSMIAASRYEQYGIEAIKRLSESARKACDFRSVVVIQPQTSKDSFKSDLDLQRIERWRVLSIDCLTLQCQRQEGNQLAISMAYDDRAIAEEDVQAIVSLFSQITIELARSLDTVLQNLDITSAEELK